MRKHIRLPGYDYSNPNFYFVTVCTRNREDVFFPRMSKQYGELMKNDVAAGLVPAKNKESRIQLTNEVENILIRDIPKRYMVENDFYVIMTNHIHWIISISDQKKHVPGDHKGRSYSLSEIVGGFKSLATHTYWRLDYSGKLFQPNFYEHIIRSDQSLDKIREYILNNPMAEYGDIPWKRIDPEINL